MSGKCRSVVSRSSETGVSTRANPVSKGERAIAAAASLVGQESIRRPDSPPFERFACIETEDLELLMSDNALLFHRLSFSTSPKITCKSLRESLEYDRRLRKIVPAMFFFLDDWERRVAENLLVLLDGTDRDGLRVEDIAWMLSVRRRRPD